MDKELQNELYKNFPKIFKEKDLNIQQSCMAWGIETGNGWYWLINNLCKMLMWDERTGKMHYTPPTALQVKEKYGTLRFYVNGANDRQDSYIAFAEYLSGSICETCGSTKDVSQTGGWIRTRCLTCHQEAGDIPYEN